MMAQYRALKAQRPDALLLFRLGDFYELFEADAEVAARELDLVLTSRDGEVPMCGIPYHALDTYAGTLVERGYRVAVAEQMEDPRTTRGLVRREVVRVLTPGTMPDDAQGAAGENRFILALAPEGASVGVAWVDVATGQFTASWREAGAPLVALMERLRPLEILSTAPLDGVGPVSVEVRSPVDDPETRVRRLVDAPAGCHPLGMQAAAMLAGYLEETLTAGSVAGGTLRWEEPTRQLLLSPQAIRHLELTRRLVDGSREGSLCWVLDETVTPMGRRCLRALVEAPLVVEKEIQARLDAVEWLLARPEVRRTLRGLLGEVRDVERLLGRLATAAPARELWSLGRSLRQLDGLAPLFAGAPALLERLSTQLAPLPQVVDPVLAMLAPDPPADPREGGILADGADPEVDALRSEIRTAEETLGELEARERAETGIRTLKLGYHRVFGYFVEVSRGQAGRVPDRYQRRQTLAGAERFTTPELRALESRIISARERAVALELLRVAQLRDTALGASAAIRERAAALAMVDALAALAEVAARDGYVRPRIVDRASLRIIDGRHPVLAHLDPQGFVPNDTILDHDRRLAIVTGPNMGGKSTYLRQSALIAIMAQMGSFVPAREAEVGLYRAVFTRVGSGDDLVGGSSTFMVEMSEVAQIVAALTPVSLVILDELGRGTSTFDGLSIAWAVAESLLEGGRCHVLMATHYHELTDLGDTRAGACNLSMAVKETAEGVVFLRRVVPGGADRSYGLQVARLAGLPAAVVERAQEVLRGLEAVDLERVEASAAVREPVWQPGLWDPPPDPVVEALRSVDIERTTPLEALNLLHRLKAMVGGAKGRG